MRGLSIILEDVVISCLVTEICKRHRKLFALGGQTYGLLLVDEEDMLLSAEKALLKMKEEKSLSSGESRTLFVKKFFKKVFPELPSLEERRRVLISPQKSWKDRDLVILWRDLADYPDLLPLVCEVFLIEVYQEFLRSCNKVGVLEFLVKKGCVSFNENWLDCREKELLPSNKKTEIFLIDMGDSLRSFLESLEKKTLEELVSFKVSLESLAGRPPSSSISFYRDPQRLMTGDVLSGVCIQVREEPAE